MALSAKFLYLEELQLDIVLKKTSFGNLVLEQGHDWRHKLAPTVVSYSPISLIFARMQENQQKSERKYIIASIFGGMRKNQRERQSRTP